MPYNLTKFIIRKPRVPNINLRSTLPPSSDGTYTLKNAFTITYTGIGLTCFMHLTSRALTTIIEQDRTHTDCLNIPLAGVTLSDVVTAVQSNPNYTITLQGVGTHPALVNGILNQNIKGVTYQAQYGITAEYLIEAENTEKFGAATVRWVKNLFSFVDRDSTWVINTGESFNVTGEPVPLNGIVELEDGAELHLTENPDNPDYDLANIKTVVDEILINSAGTGTQFVILPVLQYITPGSLVVKYNNVIKTEDVDYVTSAIDKRLNFLKNILDETTILTSPTNFIDTLVQGIGGVITDSVQVKKNGSPLTPNIDYTVPISSEYQGKNVGSGRIFFTETFIDDPVAEYVLTIEPALFNNDFFIKKNNVILDPSEYIAVLEAGFVNLAENLFPGDTLTATYRSQEFGQITDEILAGTPAIITNSIAEPFHIISGSNDTLLVAGDGNPTETISLPIGTAITFNELISAYNSQATKTFMAKNADLSRIIISSKTPGPTSSVQIFGANANSTLGFIPTLTNGAGSEGNEFAFDLANAPVEIRSFTAPEDGDTFFIKEFDVSANYQPGTIIQLNVDMYIVDSVSVINRATLYSNPEKFRISTDINDIFIIKVDGVEKVITLTAGDREAQDIADDINLITNIASVENLNGVNVLKLESPTLGIGGSLIVGEGTANLMLGFQTLQQDTGLPDTRITVKGTFNQTYTNPILRSTRKLVTFLNETISPEKTSSGQSQISFNGVNLVSKYKPNTVIKINNDSYFVQGARFLDGKTIVQLKAQLKNPLFSTDVIQYTNRPVYNEGETELALTEPAIIDLPITIKNNGIPLPSNGFTINSDGSITLSDANKLTSNSDITATYTAFTTFEAGDEIKLDYRIFSNIDQGTQVKASYEYISPDKFFMDIIYENDLANSILDKTQDELELIQNPSSQGFTSSAGGSTANSDGGNETPSLREFKYRYLDGCAEELFNFFDKRIKTITDERFHYNGWIPGADDGNVTEAQLQDSVNNVSRLFPQGYTGINPLRVPALDTLNTNDDGSGTGGTDVSQSIPDLLNAELADLNAEIPLLTQILTQPVTGPVSLSGTAIISSVDFYDGTGVDPANNEFLLKVNGSPVIVTFAASPTGTNTSLASIITQINAVSPGLSSPFGGQVLLSASISLEIQGGSANALLGFTNGQSAAIRSGSTDYNQWLDLVTDEISKNTASIAAGINVMSLNDTLMEEYTDIYTIAFDETKTHKAYIETFVIEVDEAKDQNNDDLAMNVNINSNILTRRDVTIPARITEINAELAQIALRPPQLDSYLNAGEKLIDKRYAWVSYRTNRATGTIQSIKREVDNQNSNQDQVQIDLDIIDTLT